MSFLIKSGSQSALDALDVLEYQFFFIVGKLILSKCQ